MKKMLDFYGLQADTITAADIVAIVRQWQEAVVGLDKNGVRRCQEGIFVDFHDRIRSRWKQ